MIRGKTLDAAIFDQAGERTFHGPVPVRSFGVAVDFPPCRKRLGRCKMNVTGVSDLPVYVARSVVANQAQRFPASPRQRQTAREVPLVIEVLALVDPVGLSVLGYGVEVPLLVPAGLPPATGRPDFSPVSRPSGARPAHRSTTAGQSSDRALRPVLPPRRDCLANRACTRLGSDSRRSCFARRRRRIARSRFDAPVPEFETHLRSAVATRCLYVKRRHLRTQSRRWIPLRAR